MASSPPIRGIRTSISTLIALALQEAFKPTSAVGPVLFAIFVLGVLTVVVLSIVMIIQRRRIDQGPAAVMWPPTACAIIPA